MKVKYFSLGFISAILLLSLTSIVLYKYVMKKSDENLQKESSIIVDTISISMIKINDFNIKVFKHLNKNVINKNKKIVVVNFFATWCAPCIKELPSFYSLYNENKSNDIDFIFASSENEQTIRNFKEKNKLKFNLPFYSFSEASISKVLEHRYLPTTYIINIETNTAFKIASVQNWNQPLIKNLIKTLINE